MRGGGKICVVMRRHHTKLIFIEEGFRMKLFKKVLAAALAGVLALSVLTGCNNSADRDDGRCTE